MAKTPVSTIAQYAPCVIYIRGQVTFSRIASKVEGEELAQQNQVAASKGRLPHAKPYTAISIKNPVIIDNNGKLPEQVKSVIQERFYTRQDGVLAFSQESKSPFLPMVIYSNDVPDKAGQCIGNNDTPLQGELANGLDVTVGVSLFNKNGFAGLGIKYVLINEPIKYYSNAELESDLAAMGITYSAPNSPSTPTPAPVAPPVASPVGAPVYNGTQQQPFNPQPQTFVPQQQFIPAPTASNVQPVFPQGNQLPPWESPGNDFEINQPVRTY